jgi:hypothetical protein
VEERRGRRAPAPPGARVWVESPGPFIIDQT